VSFPCTRPRRGVQLFAVARFPGAVCKQRRRRARYLAGRTAEQVFGHGRGGGGVVVHACTLQPRRREDEKSPKGSFVLSVIFSYNYTIMLYALSFHSRNASRLHCPGHVPSFVFSRILFTSSLLPIQYMRT